MKNNFFYILIIILLSSVVIFLVKKPFKTTVDIDKDMLKVDSLKVIEITYEQSGKKISITRGLNDWRIKEPGNYELDFNIKNTILQFVNDLTLKNVISDKPEKFSKFGVDSTAIVLTVRKEGNVLVSYIIGKDDQESNYSFFRKEGDNRIFLGSLFPRYRLTSNFNDWRNSIISRADLQNISKITLTKGSDVLEMNKLNSDWSAKLNDAEFDADKTKLNKLLSKIGNFKGSAFLDDKNISDINSTIVVNYPENEFMIGKILDEYVAFRKDKVQMYKIYEDEFMIFEDLFNK